MKKPHLILACCLSVISTLSYDSSALGQGSGDTPGGKSHPDYTSCIKQDQWNFCDSNQGRCLGQGTNPRSPEPVSTEGTVLCRNHSPSGVDLSRGEFFTMVDDDGFNASPVGAACPSCGSALASIPEASQLPRVRLRRIWRSTLDYSGSLGFKMYTGYDYSVNKWTSGGLTFIQLQDPNTASSETFRLRIGNEQKYDLTSTPDYHTRIIEATASHVTFLLSNGEKLRFEWTAYLERDGHTRARLHYIADRNGNQITFDYVRPATDATLDVFKWSTATDPYGHKLQFSYTVWKGLNVLDLVTLPDGRTIRYSYDTSINKLSAYKVDYGNGIESTITYDWTLTSIQNEALLSADHYKREILLSHFAPGRTRSIKRADGTFLYSRTDMGKGGANISLIYDEGETFEITSSEKKPLISSRQQRVDGSWETATRYSAANHRPIDGVSQPDGRAWQATRDNANERISRRAYPDGSVESFVYNEFSQVTRHTHRSGAVEEWKYDASGNLLSHTEAAGIAGVEATETWTYSARGQVLTYSDFNGNVTKYDYYPNGELATITLPASEGQPAGTITYNYDPAGHVIGITDPGKRSIAYKYDSIGRLTMTTYGDGSTEEKHYGTGEFSARLLSSKDRNGNQTLYEYDAAGRVRAARVKEAGSEKILSITTNTWDGPTGRLLATDVDGDSTEYIYDYKGRVLATTAHPQAGQTLTSTNVYDQYHLLYTIDPYGRKTSNTYDALDRIKAISVELTPSGQTVVSKNEYDAEGRLKARIDGNGVRDEYEYDARNRRTLERSAAGTPVEAKESYTYDGNNSLLTTTDSNGHVWKRTYTARNQVRTDSNPLGNTTTYSYLSEGLLQSITNPNNHVTRYVYDNCCGRLSQEIDADQGTISYQIDFNGNRTKTTDQIGRIIAYEYDGLNRQIKMTVDPLGLNLQTINAYDATAGAIGRKETVTGPTGQVVTSSFDGINRISRITGDTPNLIHVYDRMEGGLLKQTTTDANQITRTTLTDGTGRTSKMLDGLNNATLMTYDGNGKLKTMLDRDGRRSRYDYDARSRLTAAVKDESGISAITRYEFDAVGNLVRIIDGMGQVTAYLYDAANRRTAATYGFSTTEAKTWSYEYWPTGHLRREHKPNGVIIEYAYDNEERVASRTYSIGAEDTFTYHANGLLKTAMGGFYRTIIDRSNLDTDYDGANRLIQERQDVGTGPKTIAYTYGPDNFVTGITYPGGAKVQHSYTTRRELSEVKLGGKTQAAQTYDPMGRLQKRTYANGALTNWIYDNEDRITRLEHANVQTWNYLYSPEGDVLMRSDLTTANQSEAYAYDGLHRLIDYKRGPVTGDKVSSPTFFQNWTLDKVGNWTAQNSKSTNEVRTHNALNEITALGGAPIIHDADGNLKEDQLFKYDYDEEDRLKSVTRKRDNVVVGQYKYDALGRRVVKVANTSGTPKETHYFYDGARIIEEQSVYGVTQATYTYGNYVDEVLTMNRGGQTYYYHQNALWSVAAVTDSKARTIERYTYDAYGNPAITSGAGSPLGNVSAIGNPWMFTGRQLDEETGTYFYRARYLDTAKGRFITRDPIGTRGDPANLGNGYAYVGNNPIIRVDPTGKLTTRGWACVFAAACLLVPEMGLLDLVGCVIAANECINGSGPLRITAGFANDGLRGTWLAGSELTQISLSRTFDTDPYRLNTYTSVSVIGTTPVAPPLLSDNSLFRSAGPSSGLCQIWPGAPGCPPTPTDCFWHPWHPGCPNLGRIPSGFASNPQTRCSR